MTALPANFFYEETMALFGGPSVAAASPWMAAAGGLADIGKAALATGGGIFGSTANSGARGEQQGTINTPFVQSSPFILGDGNKTGDVGTGGASSSSTRDETPAAAINKIADALGPAARPWPSSSVSSR